MHYIVERQMTGPSDVIAPVGVTSSWRRRVICDVTAKLWVLNFLIKFVTIRAKNASKFLIISYMSYTYFTNEPFYCKRLATTSNFQPSKFCYIFSSDFFRSHASISMFTE
jgi:hypothetical protein